MQDNNPFNGFYKRHVSARSRLFMKELRRYLITGVLVTAPIAITLYLAWSILVFIDRQVAKILPGDWQYTVFGETIFPGIGLVLTIIFFIAAGWFATNFLGKIIVRFSEYIVQKMPGINTLYKAVKQVFETIFGSQAQAFREVVLIEYPRQGSWTLGFVTGIPEGEIQQGGEDLVSVFVPTAPSPMNGFLLFIPRKDMIPLKIGVEEGLKMVVSMGILSAEEKKAA
jgi:uncharacterized membrane protein